MRKESKSLQHQMTELRDSYGKLSNLEGKYTSLDRKIMAEVGKLRTFDRTMSGKVTKMSQKMAHVIRKQMSLQNQINDNKCKFLITLKIRITISQIIHILSPQDNQCVTYSTNYETTFPLRYRSKRCCKVCLLQKD
jgi:hypothetical protein